jgi:hypothetical protein
MIRTADYCAGWMDSSIHQFLTDIEAPPSSMKYALVTCLDSSDEVASMLQTSEALKPLKQQAVTKGTAVLVPTSKLLKAEQSQRIFHGFDEVWFFPSRDVAPKPGPICITGPANLTAEPPQEIVTWMESNRCSLGLGDGTGLNFVAKLRGIAKHLVNEYSVSVEGNGSAGGNTHASGS